MSFEPDPKSLAALLRKQKPGVVDAVKEVVKTGPGKLLAHVEAIQNANVLKDLTNEEVATLVTADADFAKVFPDVRKTADALVEAFAAGSKLVADHADDFVQVLKFKSFTETYFFKDICEALHKTGVLTKGDTAKKRLQDTGTIMIFDVNASKPDEYGFLAAHVMSMAHVGTLGPLYNESSIAFTLLTFSYLAARRIRGLKLDAWYLYWRIVGSFMGLKPELLPKNHNEARALYKKIRKEKAQEDAIDKTKLETLMFATLEANGVTETRELLIGDIDTVMAAKPKKDRSEEEQQLVEETLNLSKRMRLFLMNQY
jgi:hypothetical protein